MKREEHHCQAGAVPVSVTECAALTHRCQSHPLLLRQSLRKKRHVLFFEAPGKFWGKHKRKYGLAREQIETLATSIKKKIQSRRKQQLGCSSSVTEASKIKIKGFGKPMIPSHSTLTSKNLQEQKCTLLGSGIAMKTINSMWLTLLYQKVFK